MKSLNLIYDYLSNWKQKVKVDGAYGSWQELLSGIPQELILKPLLFNMFLCDLFYFLLMSWNKAIANIDNDRIESKDIYELLGITTDSKLKFENHINKLCKKASHKKHNALARNSNFMTFDKTKIIMKGFIASKLSLLPSCVDIPQQNTTISHTTYWDKLSYWENFWKFWNGPLCRNKSGTSPLFIVAVYCQSSNTKACAKKLSHILANNIENGGRGIGLTIYGGYCPKT